MSINKLNYFGTNTIQAGHYYWELATTQQPNSRIEDNIRFNPEGLIYRLNNGYMNVVTVNGLNIVAISGSPYDKRPGSKSVFWAEKGHSFQDIKEAILTLPASKKIIESMPFEIHWSF